LAVINRKIPDQVPVDLHNFLHAVYFCGMPLSRALQDGKLLAESQIRSWKEFGHDMLLVENGVVAEAGACGCEVEYYDDGPPRVANHILSDRNGGLKKVSDMEIPDPWKTPPMSTVLDAVRILRKEVGKEVFIMGRADQGPGALALALRGYERFLLDLALMEQPDEIHAVLDFCVRVQVRYANALREAGAHGTAIGGLGISLLNPRLYRQVEQPYEKRIIRDVSRPDFPVALHICGDATSILRDMVSTGAPILELDYKTSLSDAKLELRDKATFLGPINPELLWETRETEEITRKSREAIGIMAPGGGFILGPGCALAYNTPSENIHALVEAAHRYGVYNSDGSIKKQPNESRRNL
jgi:uroporphyrinogen decarboxylase